MLRNLRSFILHPPSLSVGVAFAVMSILFGTWITRIPDIQLQTGLSEGQLGLALLGFPVGAMIAMPFMGWLTSRFGVGRVTLYTTILFCLSMVLPGFTQSLWGLAASLLLAGMGAGSMDVAMNAAAAVVEKEHKKAIMSTCHAWFSLGGMLGAAVASFIAGLEVPAYIHLPAMSFIALLLSAAYARRWLTISDRQSGAHAWVWPTRSLLVLTAIGFCVLLSEGAIADWSAVYLKNTLGGSGYISGLGFAGFSLTMAVGRLYGDIIIPRYGSRFLVRWGGLLAALALGTALLIGHPVAGIVGFTVVGIGFACIIPIVFSAAANTPGVTPGGGIAAVASMGYIGFMIGPPAIGFIAEHYGLQFGLGVVVVLSLLISLLAMKRLF